MFGSLETPSAPERQWGYRPSRPLSSPMGTLNPTSPIHLQTLQDGLSQAAGQMDKPDAKATTTPEEALACA